MGENPSKDMEPGENALSNSSQLRHNLETLKASLRLDWVKMAEEQVMTPEECQDLRAYIDACINQLSEVLARLDNMDANRT